MSGRMCPQLPLLGLYGPLTMRSPIFRSYQTLCAAAARGSGARVEGCVQSEANVDGSTSLVPETRGANIDILRSAPS